jgi:hypothetical protein
LPCPKIQQAAKQWPASCQIDAFADDTHYKPAEAVLRHNQHPAVRRRAAEDLSDFLRTSDAMFTYLPTGAANDATWAGMPGRGLEWEFSIVFRYAGFLGVIQDAGTSATRA